MKAWRRLIVIALLCGAAAPGCEDRAGVSTQAAAPTPRPGPPGARWGIVDQMKADLAAKRHPADGGGRAWLDAASSTPVATVVTPGHWTIVYEAGPLGVADGGMIFLQVSPFWGWSPPQVAYPAALGYTEVHTDAEGVKLQARPVDEELLGIEVKGRALVAGERVRIVYGAGAAGALADRYAERGSRFWIAVDGDGDGIRKVLEDSPAVDVAAGPPARLIVTLPTTARPGERVRLTVAALDRLANAGVDLRGDVTFADPPAGLEMPAVLRLAAADAGRKTIEIIAREPGIYRLRATAPGGLSATSNPMVVGRDSVRVRWADLQGHSQLSDGTGSPADYFRYARDVAALDIAALTDHDHWGMLFLDQHPQRWRQVRDAVREFHQPGRFVALLAYEWTSWIHGHRHVLYFGDEGEVLSSMDPAYESPRQLWAALRGKNALTVAHHSAGGPIPTNWDIPPDPQIEPVTEIVSVHGCSEAPDCRGVIYHPRRGNFVRDALDRGYRLGFVGSGDGHDGHPGLAQFSGGPTGGVAAIFAENLTRRGVLEALRARRVYATSGARIFLRVDLDGEPMGSVAAAAAPKGGDRVLTVRAVGTAPVSGVELIRSGKVVANRRGSADVVSERFSFPAGDLQAGEYLYIRLTQEGGGMAWSSPIFLQ